MFTNNNLSPEQRAAINRSNSQHSTGAKSAAGREVSSRNHTVHGLTRHNGHFALLPFENKDEFNALQYSLANEYQPHSSTEHILLTNMSESHWLAQRAQGLLTGCLDPQTGKISDPKSFSLYLRYQTTHERAFNKALNDLLKLRSERRKEQAGFEAQKRQQAKQEAEIEEQKQAAQEAKEAQVDEQLLKDPEYRAFLQRLGAARVSNSPEYPALQREFACRYDAAMAAMEDSLAQAA